MQTRKCHANADTDADADANADTNRIRTKNQYVPLPFGGGHNLLISKNHKFRISITRIMDIQKSIFWGGVGWGGDA